MYNMYLAVKIYATGGYQGTPLRLTYIVVYLCHLLHPVNYLTHLQNERHLEHAVCSAFTNSAVNSASFGPRGVLQNPRWVPILEQPAFTAHNLGSAVFVGTGYSALILVYRYKYETQ